MTRLIVSLGREKAKIGISFNVRPEWIPFSFYCSLHSRLVLLAFASEVDHQLLLVEIDNDVLVFLDMTFCLVDAWFECNLGGDSKLSHGFVSSTSQWKCLRTSKLGIDSRYPMIEELSNTSVQSLTPKASG